MYICKNMYLYVLIYVFMCKTENEESTLFSYTCLIGELEHLKIKTRLLDEKFASVMGECVFVKL